MKTNFSIEVVITTVLITLTILLLNPFQFWMPTQLHILMLVGLAIAFVMFAGFIWKEKSADEREQLHKSVAGRWAYLIGSFILVTGIIVQSISHALDPWLISALVSMVVTKLVGFIYAEMNN